MQFQEERRPLQVFSEQSWMHWVVEFVVATVSSKEGFSSITETFWDHSVVSGRAKRNGTRESWEAGVMAILETWFGIWFRRKINTRLQLLVIFYIADEGNGYKTRSFFGLGQFDRYSDSPSISIRWKDCSKRFERFVVAMNIKHKTCKRALLLSQWRKFFLA